MTISKGTEVKILPQWQDAGDDQYTWTALESPDAAGYFKVRVGGMKTAFAPITVMHVSHVEGGVPCAS